MVCLQDVRKVPRREWPAARVRNIMTTKITTVGPSEPASEALSALSQQHVNQLPVVETGRLRGLIRREDLLRWLSIYGDARRGEELAPDRG
jgi:CBS domain-containing protein